MYRLSMQCVWSCHRSSSSSPNLWLFLYVGLSEPTRSKLVHVIVGLMCMCVLSLLWHRCSRGVTGGPGQAAFHPHHHSARGSRSIHLPALLCNYWASHLLYTPNWKLKGLLTAPSKWVYKVGKNSWVMECFYVFTHMYQLKKGVTFAS